MGTEMQASRPKAKRSGSGYSSIYKTNEWKKSQSDFEMRLGKYAYNHPKSAEAVNKGLNRMKKVIYEHYRDKTKDYGSDMKDIFIKAFAKDDHTSAGQVGKMVGEEIFKIVGKNIPSEIGDKLEGAESGNLREKMTAFYNAAYYNSAGLSKEGAANSINFKNIMQKIVTDDGVAGLVNELGLDANSVNEAKKHASKNIFKAGFRAAWHNRINGSDVYSCPVMAYNSKDKEDSYVKNFFRYGKRKEGYGEVARPYDYQERMGLDPSNRELAYRDNQDGKNIVKEIVTNTAIKNGEYYREVKRGLFSDIPKLEDEKGFTFIAGMSGTTGRMLNTYKWLGLNNNEDLLNFRLALMGWMLPERDHTLYEILKGSHMVGVRGDEDMTDAASMDESISPLTEEEIRENCGESHKKIRIEEVFCNQDQDQDMFSYGCNELKIEYKKIVENQYILPIEEIFHQQNKRGIKEKNLEEIRDFKYSELSEGESSLLGAKMNLAHLQAMMTYKTTMHRLLNGKLEFNRFIKNDYWFELVLRKQMKETLQSTLYKKILKRLLEMYNFPEKSSNKYYKIHSTPYNNMSNVILLYKNIIKIQDITEQFDGIDLNWKNIVSGKCRCAEDIKNKFLDKAILIVEKYVDKWADFIIEDFEIGRKGKRLRKILKDINVTNNMIADGLRKAPKYEGKVYSGQKLLMSYRKDNIINYSMFTSTTDQKTVAADYYKGAILVLKLKNTGVEVRDELDQILIPPGTKFKVEKVTTIPEEGDEVTVGENKTKRKPVTYVYLEEVGSDESKYSDLPPRLNTYKWY